MYNNIFDTATFLYIVNFLGSKQSKGLYMKTILTTALVARHGPQTLTGYRAVLLRDKGGKAILSIEQPIKDGFYGCGRWRLSTLLDRFQRRDGGSIYDGLSLDHGQDWYIETGIKAAIIEAATILSDSGES
jgi:hypothetical protein